MAVTVDLDLAIRVEGAAVAQQVATSLAIEAADPRGPARHRLVADGALLHGGPGIAGFTMVWTNAVLRRASRVG